MANLSSKTVQLLSVCIPVAVVAGGLVFTSLRPQAAARAAVAESGIRQPVLVELFTSEGCSSCPPADALLERLDKEQFVPGAHAIVLSEHVTYWNELGWKDPFSADSATERQQQYAQRFGLDSVYTPQAVVDGDAELVGSDSGGLRRAVARAAATPKPDLKIESAAWTPDGVHFSVRSAAANHGRLMVAIAEDATRSDVARGENAGRTLHHVAVVRVLTEMGADVADGRPLNVGLHGGSVSGSGPLRLVVFLTENHGGRVLAASEQTITR